MAGPILLEVTGEEVGVIVEALRSESSRLQRAATRAARELAAEVAAGAVTDKRPGSVKIVGVLHQAGALEAFADKLLHASRDADDPRIKEPPRDERPSGKVARLLSRKLPGEAEADEVTDVPQEGDEPDIPPSVLDPDQEGNDVDVIELGEASNGD